MMTMEQVQEHIATLTGASLDGNMPENMEEIISAFRDDYEEYYNSPESNEDDLVYKEKYEDLREKYIKRFSGIEIKDPDLDTNVPDDKQKEPTREEQLANVTISDLFERRK